MNFQEIPFNGGWYNLKKRFALHVKCTELFIFRYKTYSFYRECVCVCVCVCVCGVSDTNFLEDSFNRTWDAAEILQLSSDKVTLVIKGTKT